MIEGDIGDMPDSLRAKYRAQYPELGDKLAMFDPRIYLGCNKDVAEVAVSVEDLVRHFCDFGYRECRIFAAGVTYQMLFSEAYPHLAWRLRSFDPQEYARANQDVVSPCGDSRVFFEHYCRYGSTELRVICDDGLIPDRRVAIQQATGVSIDYDMLAYAHLFFAEPGKALVPYLRNLAAMGARIALSFSSVTYSLSEMERYAVAVSAKDNPVARYWQAPPLGRDWGGFYNLWQNQPPADDTAVFLLHSKKSQHLAPVVGDLWRNELLAPICGGYGAVLTVVEKLRSGYSMVGSALHRSRNIGPSRALVAELLPLLNLGSNVDDQEFVAGTMFAIQGKVLNEFFQAVSGVINFARQTPDASQFDGSMAHACERLIGYFASTQRKGICWLN